MPLRKGKSKAVVSENIAEFHGGKMVKKATIDLPRKAEWLGF